MDNSHTLTKHTPSLPTDAELLSVFPEAVPIVKRLIKDTKQKIEEIKREQEPHFNAALERFYTHDGDPEREELFTILAKFWYLDLPMQVRVTLVGNHPTIITQQSELARLERILKLHSIRQAVTNSPDEVNELTIRNAKQRRIEEFLSEKPNHAGFIRCPFHNEKTPSCKVNGSRFHCFGCSEDGDVIDWIMKTNDKSFLDAVRMLNRT